MKEEQFSSIERRGEVVRLFGCTLGFFLLRSRLGCCLLLRLWACFLLLGEPFVLSNLQLHHHHLSGWLQHMQHLVMLPVGGDGRRVVFVYVCDVKQKKEKDDVTLKTLHLNKGFLIAIKNPTILHG